jgi:inosose dehydratase
MKLRVGTAPDSWGVWFPDDPLQTPWTRYLDEVVEAGYRIVELGPFGYLPTDPPVLRRELEQRGLQLTGGTLIGPLHDPAAVPALREQALRLGDLLATMGAMFVVLIPDSYRDRSGQLLRPPRLDADGWKQLVETTNLLGRLVRERYPGQLQLTFHSHADSHVEYPDQVEALLAETDPDLVQICLDMGHLEYRGGDSIAFMRRHHARTPYLHIKTVHPELRRIVQERDLSFVEAVRMGTFCEPQEGVIDFPAFAQLLREIDYNGWAVVEQDMYPCDFDKPLPIAKRTRQYLLSLGLG